MYLEELYTLGCQTDNMQKNIHEHSEVSPFHAPGKWKRTFIAMGVETGTGCVEGNLTECIKNYKIPHSFSTTPKTI